MEKRVLFLVVCLLLSAGSLSFLHAEKIKGNGTVVTKEFQVGSFKQVSVGPGVECSGSFFNKSTYTNPVFNYTQSSGGGSLSITTDENLLPYLKIQSEGDVLSISTEKNIYINPSQLKINGRSKDLNKVTISGCIDLAIVSTFTSDLLDISISGASDMKLNQSAKIDQFNVRISGAGDLVAENLVCQTIDCNISGAGDITVKGNADKAKFNVSGAGDIKAYDFAVKDLECKVTGSGDAKVRASETLNASVSGTGDIYYKGNAKASTKVSGFGDIKKVND